jgi:nitrite reductase/ring-hydroxylating ferredoxin subunit
MNWVTKSLFASHWMAQQFCYSRPMTRCSRSGTSARTRAGLDRGVVKIAGSVRTVTCPAHGSVFRLDDGKVMRPPATKPVPVYDVKVEDGRVFVRPRTDT